MSPEIISICVAEQFQQWLRVIQLPRQHDDDFVPYPIPGFSVYQLPVFIAGQQFLPIEWFSRLRQCFGQGSRLAFARRFQFSRIENRCQVFMDGQMQKQVFRLVLAARFDR